MLPTRSRATAKCQGMYVDREREREREVGTQGGDWERKREGTRSSMGDFLLPRVAPIFSLKGRDSLWSVAGGILCACTSMKREVTVMLLSQTPTKASQFHWHVVACSAIIPLMKHHVDNPRKQVTYWRIKCKVSRCTFQTPAGILGFPKDLQQVRSKQRHLQIILENGSQLHMTFNFVYRTSCYSLSIDKNSSCRCCRQFLSKKRSTNKRRTYYLNS
jgi:hypothetical protein